jgi:hypothetical protein
MIGFRFLTVVLPALFLGACTTLQGGPVAVGNSATTCLEKNRPQSALAVLAEQQCTPIDWLSGDPSGLRSQRNHVVTIRMYVADRNYDAFERQLLNESRSGNFTTTLAQLGLSSAASLVTQGPTSRALSALGTAVTGAKQGFDRDIMLERTIQILTTQMRASRAKVKELILSRLDNEYAKWPIGLAMADLEAYEQAGTLNSALNATAENAATAKKTNEAAAEKQVPSFAYDTSLTSTTLQDYIGIVDNTLAAKRETNLRSAMTAAGVPTTVSLHEFVIRDNPLKAKVLLNLIGIERDNADAMKILESAISSK